MKVPARLGSLLPAFPGDGAVSLHSRRREGEMLWGDPC